MSDLPNDLEHVEILVDGKWIPAVFYECGYWPSSDEEWWSDYFMAEDEDDTTYPENTQEHATKLPQWRRLQNKATV